MSLAGRLRLALVAVLLAMASLTPGAGAAEGGAPDPRTAAAYEALADFFAADTPSSDLAKAVLNYEKAADAGSTSALIKLAALLARQPGDADAARAAALLREAITRGAAGPAGDALGDLYRDDPRLRDRGQALSAYGEAAAAGHPGAVEKIGALLAAGGIAPTEQEQAVAVLETSAAGSDPAPAAFQLARFLAAGGTQADLARARRYYDIAAAGGIGEAHLALAEMAADRFQDPRIRRQMVDHYLGAAALLGVDTVALRLEALPQPVLLAIVRDLLVERGLGIVPLSGPDADNPDVVAGFCQERSTYYCSEQVIPWDMLVELIGGTRPR